MAKLGDILQIKYGKNLPTEKLIQSGYYVFGGNGVIGYNSTYMYESPKVLISCRGAASGRVCFSYPYSFITNNSLILEDNENITFNYLRGFAINSHFEQYTTGSAQPQITIENIYSLKIPTPNRAYQDNFNHEISDVLIKIEIKRNENIKLNKLKQLYLKKFFN